MAQLMGLSASLHAVKAIFIITIFYKMAVVTSTSLRLNEVAELCSGNFITQDYDGSWDASNVTINSTFYIPMASKYTGLLLSLNLYRTQTFEAINEAQLESSCMSLKRLNSWQTINVTGYNGDDSTLMFLAPTTVPKLYRFHLGFPDVVTGAGYASIALSDSESYNLFDFCFDNGLRSFAVISTRQQLDESTRNIIKAHVKSLGFQEKNFLNLNYDSCFEKDGILVTNGEDLPKPSEAERVLLYPANSILGRKLALPYIVKG
jgi:hypothetical protein